jgi:outer membrane protein assembly factor BamA
MKSLIKILLLSSSLFLFLTPVKSQIIKDICVTGNLVTNKDILLRELRFSIGDTIEPADFNQIMTESKENLMNISLFVTVDISWEMVGENVVLYINVRERWYYWVYPILEHADRNFSSFIKSADWDRINYGLTFEKHNFRGKNEFLKFKLRFGYRAQYGFMYENPAISKNKTQGINMSVDFFQQEKLISGISDDKPVYYFSPGENGLSELRLRFGYNVRPDLFNKFKVLLEFQNFEFSDSLLIVNPDFYSNSKGENSCASIYLKYENDHRDNRFFPLKGYYFSTQLSKLGIGVVENSSNLLTLKGEAEYYTCVWKNLYWASQFYLKMQLQNKGNVPFYYSELLGYDFTPRGYEYYVVHGDAVYGLNETFRYRFFSKPVHEVNWIPIKQFKTFYYSMYAYTFFDMAYTESKMLENVENILPNAFLYSAGLGLELETYYDRSFSVHLAMTNKKAFGIFVSLRSPIYKTF